MPIFKKQDYDDRITKLTNKFLQDSNITLEAKGLLGYMLSLPQNWKFTIDGIANQTSTSTKKIIKLLHELEKFGYHTKIHKYENGRIKEWIYYTFAEPQEKIINKTFDITDFELDCINQQCSNQHCYFEGDKQIISNKLDIKQEKKLINKIDNVEKKDKFLKENIECIIDYLNESINSNYKYTTKGTITLIKARFKEGYKLDDFYDVIDKKVKEWKNTEMEKYLRPETLFGNKFENYLNQKETFKGTPKISYSSQPIFDNTATHNIPKGVASMTAEERKEYEENELARDDNGNLIKF